MDERAISDYHYGFHGSFSLLIGAALYSLTAFQLECGLLHPQRHRDRCDAIRSAWAFQLECGPTDATPSDALELFSSRVACSTINATATYAAPSEALELFSSSVACSTISSATGTTATVAPASDALWLLLLGAHKRAGLGRITLWKSYALIRQKKQ